MNKPVENLVIIGAGGHAQVVIDAVQEQGVYNILGLVNKTLVQDKLMGYDIKPDLSAFPKCHFLVAVGDNKTRMRLFEQAKSQGWLPAKIIHPSAIVSKHASIDPGTIICAGAIVGAMASVGSNSIINTAVVVSHDCQVGSHVHLAVGARMTGKSIVQDGAFIGSGAVLIPGVTAGAWSTVGAGAVVVRDIAAGVTAVGVPAQPLRKVAAEAIPE